MSDKQRYGDGEDCNSIPPARQTVNGTTPIVSNLIGMMNLDSIAFQLITEDVVEAVPYNVANAVVGSTKTFTFPGFTFTGKTGATIRIVGSDDNDGDHVVTSVGTHTAVCSASTLTDETFAADVTITVLRSDDPVTGAWTIEISNNYVAPTNGSAYGAIANEGKWTDITDAFSPAIAAVTAASNQYVQADLTARTVKATFTPTDGNGTVLAIVFAKSWS